MDSQTTESVLIFRMFETEEEAILWRDKIDKKVNGVSDYPSILFFVIDDSCDNYDIRASVHPECLVTITDIMSFIAVSALMYGVHKLPIVDQEEVTA